MKKTINFNDFVKEFEGSQYDKQFSYNGKKALFEYLEEIEGQDKEEIELDIVAICCDFTEYKTFSEIQDNYTSIKTMEELENNTTVLRFDEGIIIQNF